MERSVAIKEENKVVKLYTLGNLSGEYNRVWGSTDLDHPSTFETGDGFKAQGGLTK